MTHHINHPPIQIQIILLLLLLIHAATTTKKDLANNEDQQIRRSETVTIHATFINDLPDTYVNLYWAGKEGSLQLYYGPLEPNGGKRSIDGFEGQMFVLTEVGGYRRAAEYRLGSNSAGSSSSSSSRETFILTKESMLYDDLKGGTYKKNDKGRGDNDARRCRSVTQKLKSDSETFLDRCQQCATVDGCGYSLTRKSCFVSHMVASVNTVDECKQLDEAIQSSDMSSVDDLINRANQITMHGVEQTIPMSLRFAYICLDLASKRAVKGALPSDSASKKAQIALVELATKLEAVFDDLDMDELLKSSQHPKLEELHDMDKIPRRTAVEAKEYIIRGEPVVITDWFNGMVNPVAHKWTLEYLNQMFNRDSNEGNDPPKFNIAADISTQCCRYFEPQETSWKLGYPYPFAPTTHLYRDSFEGFVKTVRKSNTDNFGPIYNKPNRLLHYLHEIVMNREGNASVGGGKAPQQLVEDLATVTTQLKPLASKQPFFGDFAFAKIWIGMKGIVMPLHYDATDNMYVMAWGRKKAIIGKPGQLDELYRYPNAHPLVGSSQVNLTDPDLHLYPGFEKAELAEVVVGPGDILYLPAFWWQ